MDGLHARTNNDMSALSSLELPPLALSACMSLPPSPDLSFPNFHDFWICNIQQTFMRRKCYPNSIAWSLVSADIFPTLPTAPEHEFKYTKWRGIGFITNRRETYTPFRELTQTFPAPLYFITFPPRASWTLLCAAGTMVAVSSQNPVREEYVAPILYPISPAAYDIDAIGKCV